MAELRQKWSTFLGDDYFEAKVVEGGVEVQLDMHQLAILNQILKIPTRILLRIDSFRCRDLPKLYKKLQKISWNLYLHGEDPEFSITSNKSRLFDDRKIKTTALESVKKFYAARPFKKNRLDLIGKVPSNTIYLRFDNDDCQLSIDTSGAPLYKRGQDKFIGKAPIRENLASALLFNFKKHSKSKLLIDPMCGSGTFLIEAKNWFTPLKRDFAYQNFLNANFPEHDFSNSSNLWEEFRGYDFDSEVAEIAKSNFESSAIQKEDLFDEKASDFQGDIIINPPYNKRLKNKDEDMVDLDKYYAKVISHISKKYFPEFIGIVSPREVKINANIVEKLKFLNGGLKVKFTIIKCL
jgi:putative N6-adenine-specific DNA methylase